MVIVRCPNGRPPPVRNGGRNQPGLGIYTAYYCRYERREHYDSDIPEVASPGTPLGASRSTFRARGAEKKSNQEIRRTLPSLLQSTLCIVHTYNLVHLRTAAYSTTLVAYESSMHT